MDPFAQLVPFGKYRGQAFAVLLADHEYVQWLLSQSWFANRYPAIHMTIINNGAEPEETPAHNTMQLLFLAERLCIAVAILYHCTFRFSVVPHDLLPAGCSDMAYEHNGIDVSFDAVYQYEITAERRMPDVYIPVEPERRENWGRLTPVQQQVEQDDFRRRWLQMPERYRQCLADGTQPEGSTIAHDPHNPYRLVEIEWIQDGG